jgi:hypothetical protein
MLTDLKTYMKPLRIGKLEDNNNNKNKNKNNNKPDRRI